jgi:hypothetical protein
MGILEEFHEEMINIYKKAKKECNYNAKIFLTMVVDHGGLEAAKILLSSDAPQYGFEKLWEYGRLDLTMEALALRPQYRSLFSDQELKMAEKRLRDYGYNFPI